MLTRREVLAAGAATATPLVGLLYAWRVEPHWLDVTRRDLPIAGLPLALEGRTLAHLSDLHVGPRVDDDYVIETFRRVAGLRRAGPGLSRARLGANLSQNAPLTGSSGACPHVGREAAMRHLQHHATLIVVLVPLALAACDTRGTLDSADLTPPLRPMAKQIWDPVIDPADFEDGSGNPNEINNSYFPLPIGRTWHYELETEDGTETTEVVVTNETKVILGVTTTVVRSQEFLDGTLIEDTDDWFAQDIDGNVWYFGEASVAYDNGIPSTEGSWEAGVDGALPGIIMLGDPAIGQQYNQEFAPDVAEDMGMVLFLDASVSVPAGDYTGCLKTMDWTPLEPGQREFKYYCPGTGLVLEVSPRDGGERNELVHVN